MERIQQGDQYAIPLVLKYGGRTVVPSNDNSSMIGKYPVDTVKVEIGGIIKTSGNDAELKYMDGKWLFYMKENESRYLDSVVPWQFCVSKGSSVHYSPVYTLEVKKSLLDLIGFVSLEQKENVADNWEPGRRSGSTGAIGSSAGRVVIDENNYTCYGIRTATYLSQDIQYIQTNNSCYPFLFAYDNNTYIGYWNGTSFIQNLYYIVSETGQTINVANIKKLYPEYQYRVIIMDTTRTDAAFTSEDIPTVLTNYAEYVFPTNETNSSTILF